MQGSTPKSRVPAPNSRCLQILGAPPKSWVPQILGVCVPSPGCHPPPDPGSSPLKSRVPPRSGYPQSWVPPANLDLGSGSVPEGAAEWEATAPPNPPPALVPGVPSLGPPFSLAQAIEPGGSPSPRGDPITLGGILITRGVPNTQGGVPITLGGSPSLWGTPNLTLGMYDRAMGGPPPNSRAEGGQSLYL